MKQSTLTKGFLYKGLWKIEKILYGGFGEIAIGKSKLKNRKQIALKYLPHNAFWISEQESAFLNEAILWTTILPHPNICKAYNVDKLWYGNVIVLEYVDGGSLRNKINKGPLKLLDIINYSIQFAQGMAFLNESYSLVHRDIKPENILITKSNKVKISDFGLSSANTLKFVAVQKQNDLFAENVKSKIIAGTLPYMSPEHFIDFNAVNTKSDIYSFGIVLYEMITGVLPFNALSFNEYKNAHLSQTYTKIYPTYNIPEQLINILDKCLSKNPCNRFANFTELLNSFIQINESMNIQIKNYSKITVNELEKELTYLDWTEKGYSLGKLRKFEDSLYCYKKALELEPSSIGSHSNVGTALLRLGKKEEALKYHEEELKLNPTEPLILFGVANEYMKIGRCAEAIKLQKDGLTYDPNNIRGWRKLSIMCRRQNDETSYKVAINEILRLLDFENYSNIMYCVNEAIHLAESGDMETALIIHEKSIKLYPNDWRCYYNCAVTLARCFLFSESVEFFRNALEIENGNLLSRLNLGIILLLEGDLVAGLLELQKCEQYNPNNKFSNIIKDIIVLIMESSREYELIITTCGMILSKTLLYEM